MPITVQHALAQLQAHPKTFLSRYAVWIMGTGTGPSGTRNFEIIDADAEGVNFLGVLQRPDTFWGTRKMHTTQTFGVTLAQGLGGHAFQAQWLKMSEWTDSRSLHAIDVLTLDHSGPGLLFTGSLTGCSVAMQNLGNNRVAIAHVRPNSDMPDVAQGGMLDGAGVNTILSKSGWTAVYGRHNYADNRQATVVGVRRGGHWQIYAQKQEYGGHGAGSIRSVKRIFG